jgi:transcriptional regulator with XRE-family HTH domain
MNMQQQYPSTLKASLQGKKRIKEAREKKGWKSDADYDDRSLEAAKAYLISQQETISGISAPTWKKYLQASARITAKAFKAYSAVLNLSWQDIADRDGLNIPIVGDPPTIEPFYGRTWYLGKLRQWVVQQRERLILVYGQLGIGKTALVRQFVEKVRIEHSTLFDEIIWLTPDSLLPELFPDQLELSPQPASFLLELLNKQNSLIILDGWTEVLGLNRSSRGNAYQNDDSIRLLQEISRKE